MPLCRKRRRSTPYELLAPFYLDSLPPSSRPVYPDFISRTKTSSSRPWTGPHIQKQTGRSLLQTKYTLPSLQCLNAFLSSLFRPSSRQFSISLSVLQLLRMTAAVSIVSNPLRRAAPSLQPTQNLRSAALQKEVVDLVKALNSHKTVLNN